MTPTLGHPSRILAIKALRRQGKTEGEIAAMLGIKPNTVSSIECRARKRKSVGNGGAHKLRISGELLADLSDEAERRNTSPAVLAQKIVRIVARDDLFAAVLD